MKPIKGFEDKYAITRKGKVWHYAKSSFDSRGRPRKKRGYYLKNSIAVSGYPVVNLTTDGGKQRVYLIHRLVAETYIPNPRNLPQVNHLNQIKTDCRIKNLEWCTAKQNISHSYLPGRNHFKTRFKRLRGISNGNAKLSEKDVLFIRELGTIGVSQYRIANMVGISRSTVRQILCGVTWKHIFTRTRSN